MEVKKSMQSRCKKWGKVFLTITALLGIAALHLKIKGGKVNAES